MSFNNIIELKNVTKIYRVGKIEVQALKNINLKIRKGEFAVILGTSGSGKTTLLNLIGGIDRPSSESIVVNGVEINKLNEEDLTRFRRKNIGFMFQFFNLIPTLTAKENIIGEGVFLEVSMKNHIMEITGICRAPLLSRTCLVTLNTAQNLLNLGNKANGVYLKAEQNEFLI